MGRITAVGDPSPTLLPTTTQLTTGFSPSYLRLESVATGESQVYRHRLPTSIVSKFEVIVQRCVAFAADRDALAVAPMLHSTGGMVALSHELKCLFDWFASRCRPRDTRIQTRQTPAGARVDMATAWSGRSGGSSQAGHIVRLSPLPSLSSLAFPPLRTVFGF